jgi:hypothetical protein
MGDERTDLYYYGWLELLSEQNVLVPAGSAPALNNYDGYTQLPVGQNQGQPRYYDDHGQPCSSLRDLQDQNDEHEQQDFDDQSMSSLKTMWAYNINPLELPSSYYP